MNDVMVDNWLLEDIVVKSNDSTMPDSLGVLLSAIVLWDNVYYPLNPMSFFWSKRDISGVRWEHEIDSLRDTLISFNDTDKKFQVEQTDFFRSNRDLFEKNTAEVVAVGALKYLSISNKQGLDYLPCAERKKFISKYPDACRKSINRIDTLAPLEKELEEFLDDLSAAFGGSCLTVKRPVLADYIISKTPPEMSCFDYALHLKHEGPVVEYKRYLDKLEKAINNYELEELIRLKQYSKEVVQGVINMDSDIASASFNILPVPKISLSKSIKITNKLHLTFLEDLARNSLLRK